MAQLQIFQTRKNFDRNFFCWSKNGLKSYFLDQLKIHLEICYGIKNFIFVFKNGIKLISKFSENMKFFVWRCKVAKMSNLVINFQRLFWIDFWFVFVITLSLMRVKERSLTLRQASLFLFFYRSYELNRITQQKVGG